MIELKLSSETIDSVQNQLALGLTFEDQRPLKGQVGWVDWRLNGFISRLMMSRKFSGSRGEALLMPSQGRLQSSELLILGLGSLRDVHEAEIPYLLGIIVERLLRKKCTSFVLSLSDIVPGMFEWRNTVRKFISLLSGRAASYKITLVEPKAFILDAKRRHMDFSYDVQVRYH